MADAIALGPIARSRSSAQLESHEAETSSLSRSISRPESSATSYGLGAHAGEDLHAQELQPVDGGKGAWQFVACGFMMEFILWGYSGAFGAVQLYLSHTPPFDTSSLASLGAPGTVQLGLFYFLPLPFLFICRRWPHLLRRSLWIALVVNVISFLASSFATSVLQLILLQGIVGGVSGAVLYIPVINYLEQWWVDRRGMAAGVIFAGTGLGGMIFPLALSELLDKLGFAWATRLWTFVVAITMTPSVYYARPRLPVVRPAPGAKFAPVDLSFLTNRSTIPLIFLSLTASLAWFPVSLYVNTYTTSLASELSGNIVLSVLNGGYTLGGVLIGWLSDRMGYSWLLAFLGLTEGIAALASWGTASSLSQVFGFVILFGFLGNQLNAWTAASRDLSGSNAPNAAVIFSFMCALRGISAIAGPLCAAMLYKPELAGVEVSWGKFGFGNVQVWVATMALGSCASALLLAAVRPTSRRAAGALPPRRD